jgi:alanyl-tRNA synthetase
VDTGAGLERIAMVLQGKKNTFEIDLWEPVIELISELKCKKL